MWTVPAGSPPLEEDIAFNAVTLEDLLQGLQEQPQHDVFDLLVAKVLRDLARVREHLQAGRLAIELFHGVLKPVGEPGGAELIRRIAALRPYTMSWSNVLDYFPLEDFHEAARRCSVHGDTVHYGYSMNWVTEVFGTSISDFEGQQEVTNSILDMSLHGPAEEFGRLSGIDSLLSVPFFDTPLNLCGYVLAQCFHGKWLDFFFEKADVSLARMRRSADSPPGAGGGSGLSPGNQGLSRGSGCMMLPCPLYRTTVAVYMSWTYDSNLKLQSFHDNKYDSLFGALNAAF